MFALLTSSTEAYRLQQRAFVRYEEGEGPTKADNGDSDFSVVNREADINEKSEHASGWTNPLSWTDNGEDDDLVVNMKFKSLNEDYEDPFTAENYTYELEDEIQDSL